MFEIGNQSYQNYCDFCWTILHGWNKISCLERMYPANLMKEMCQVVIRQCEGYTQHKPEVVDNYEPFCDFLQDPESVCSKGKF